MKPRLKLPLMFTKNLRRSMLAEGAKIFLAVCAGGGLWGLVEVLAFFFPDAMKWAQNNWWAFLAYAGTALLITIVFVWVKSNAMLPVSESLEARDCSIEIQVGDIFKMKGEFIIGTNTDFATDMSPGPISEDSLQGQFTTKYYAGRGQHLYQDLEESLAGEKHTLVENTHRQTKRYEFGTVAKVSARDQNVYFVAIDELDKQGVATSSLEKVRESLSKLWRYIGDHGEVRDLVIPIVGTKGAKIPVLREVMIIEIINSFINATYSGKNICENLKIVIYEKDYWAQDIDLDELGKFLHVRATERRWRVEEPDTPVGKSV